MYCPDVGWNESNARTMERDEQVRQLEKANAELLSRSGSAMRQLGEYIVRVGNLEAQLGIERLRRIAAERKGK